MQSDAMRQEIAEIIGEERAAQIEQGVIEKHRQLYSDAQMWAMLDERQERMASLLWIGVQKGPR